MSALPEVTRLVPGDSNVQPSSSTLSTNAGNSGVVGGGGQLPPPNEHTNVGRTPSTASYSRSLRAVHIKDPPESETGPPSSSAPLTATDGDQHGPLHQAIPVMPVALAVTCCILNILLPGIGTHTHDYRYKILCRKYWRAVVRLQEIRVLYP